MCKGESQPSEQCQDADASSESSTQTDLSVSDVELLADRKSKLELEKLTAEIGDLRTRRKDRLFVGISGIIAAFVALIGLAIQGPLSTIRAERAEFEAAKAEERLRLADVTEGAYRTRNALLSARGDHLVAQAKLYAQKARTARQRIARLGQELRVIERDISSPSATTQPHALVLTALRQLEETLYPPGFWKCVAFEEGHGLLAARFDGTVVMTQDAGRTWAKRRFSGDSLPAIAAPANGSYVAVASGESVHVKRYDSESWEAYTPGINEAILCLVCSHDGARLVAVADRSFASSDDYGFTWDVRELSRDLFIPTTIRSGGEFFFSAAWVSSVGQRMIVGGSSGFGTPRPAVFVSDSGLFTFIPRSMDIDEPDWPATVNCIVATEDGTRCWASVGYLQQAGPARPPILRSLDGGESWTELERPDCYGISSLFASSSGDVLWAAGDKLLLSIDGGDTWVDRTPDILDSWAWGISGNADGSKLWCVGDDLVVESADGGKTWTSIGYPR